MKIPKSITINGVRIRIQWVKNLRSSTGQVLQGQHSGIDDEMSLAITDHEDRAAMVFLHEIIHAIDGDLNLKMKEKDVRQLAACLHGVIVTNNLDFRTKK